MAWGSGPVAGQRVRASGSERRGSPASRLARVFRWSAFGTGDAEKKLVSKVEEDHCCSKLVLMERSLLRIAWTAIVTVLLLYTGTIFLYRICFIDFYMDPAAADILEPTYNTTLTLPHEQDGWARWEVIVTFLFWIDLFANFFFSYEDPSLGHEVGSLRLIARHYLSGYFAVNLAACIPEELVKALLNSMISDSGSYASFNQGARVARLQRISRLARLVRLARLGKLTSHFKGRAFETFQQMKGVRLVNLTVGLMWIVHVLACGWYLCAALHDNAGDTWVARRKVDGLGEVALVERPPVDQWMHSMYFVLTVFTTVGFGDIAAFTLGEIVYVGFTMGVGAVVHSIIISEVISVVTSNDKLNVFVSDHIKLVEAFAEHTELDEVAVHDVTSWIARNASNWLSRGYDRDEMKMLITGRFMPRELLGRLPAALYGGRLLRNDFLKVCKGVRSLPPRLPVLLALAVDASTCIREEVIYEANDYPFSIFLVLRGTFACVALPSPSGGTPLPRAATTQRSTELKRPALNHGPSAALRGKGHSSARAPVVPPPLPKLFPYQLFSAGSYFGDVEVLQNAPRKATVRCESRSGSLLTLHKTDLKNLSEEFPQFGSMWRSRAQAREVVRRRYQAQLKEGLDYCHLAAVTMQRFFKLQSSRPWDSAGACLDVSFSSPRGLDLARHVQAAASSKMGLTTPRATTAAGGDPELRAALSELRREVAQLTQELQRRRIVSEWL